MTFANADSHFVMVTQMPIAHFVMLPACDPMPQEACSVRLIEAIWQWLMKITS